MYLITTTELRTKTPELISHLESGNRVTLMHRSRVIGKVHPEKKERGPLKESDVEDMKKILAYFSKLAVKNKISVNNYKEVYRKRLMGKYGKYIS